MAHTLIFSDTHLGPKFQPGKFNLLKEIINAAEKVIINGDFWEAYLWDFDDFLNSAWNKLFPLLQERKTVYLYGNHDREKLSDERRLQFCVQAGDTYKLRSGNRVFHIEHGNRIVPELDERYPWLSQGFPAKIIPTIESWGVFKISQGQLERRYRKQNEQMKAWATKNLTNGEVLVCGHSHLAEVNLEHRFVNSGLIKWGIAQFLTIEDGTVSLHNRKYRD